jgi:putative component of membrane protein insertase Oxa1/YidC/SpoIIIJ protein YidD
MPTCFPAAPHCGLPLRFDWILASFFLVSCLARPVPAAWDDAKSPWTAPGKSFSDWTQASPDRALEAWEALAVKDTPKPKTSSLLTLLPEDMLWFYQHSLSGHTGNECPHYPSCSRYALIAIDSYGPLLGAIMTAERLERCHEGANDKGQYAWREIDGLTRIWDPPSLDAWWEGMNP